MVSLHLEFINVDLELATKLGGANMTQAKEQFIKVHHRLLDVINQLPDLNSMQSREEAYSYISSSDLKKADLEAICKQLDLPFTKKENIKALQEKIIEGTVGYKLRSQAIQK